MKRNIALGLLISIISLTPANSADLPKKSLVIMDTGFDTQLPIFQGKVLQEVCILDWYTCPNRLDFQEGQGSAQLSLPLAKINGFSHGTQMASIAVNYSSETPIILIRIIANSSSGLRLPAGESSIIRALEWVIAHNEEFNIGAVAMAQGRPSSISSRDYCPKSERLEKRILELKRLDIPFVVPAGNGGNKSRIDWPACIPSTVAIGASTTDNKIAKFSNVDRLLVDFYAQGNSPASLPGGQIITASGTSVSTLIAAARWLKEASAQPTANYAQLYRYLRTGPIIFDENFNYGRLLNVN